VRRLPFLGIKPFGDDDRDGDAVMDTMKKLPLCLAAAVTSGAMLWLGTGLHPIWWLTWIATLPVLLLVPRVSWWLAYGMAFLAWAMGQLNEWSYLHLVDVPLIVKLVVVIGPALLWDLHPPGWCSNLRYKSFRRTPPSAASPIAS
jgi:hypothetical protein